MRAVVVVVTVLTASCSNSSQPSSARSSSTSTAAVDKAGVKAIADRLVEVAQACDTSKVDALIDREGFRQLVVRRAPDERAALRKVESFLPPAATKLCSWIGGAGDFRVLHVRPNDGETQAVIRKVSETSFGYWDVRATGSTKAPRLLDLYSHSNGVWLSQEIAETLMLPGGDDLEVSLAITRINQLEQEGRLPEALAAMDALPERLLNTRVIQSRRFALAGGISRAAIEQALAERARRLPDEKLTPITAITRAIVDGNLAEALRQVDVLDAAVGGDPLLDAIRASALLQLGGPGDLEDAAARADRAVRAAPGLAMPHQVKLGVALARSQWATAIEELEALERLGRSFSEEDLPNAAGLLASPEYAAWRKRRP